MYCKLDGLMFVFCTFIEKYCKRGLLCPTWTFLIQGYICGGHPFGDCCGEWCGLGSCGDESGLRCRLVDDLDVGAGDSGLPGGTELLLVVDRSCGLAAACTGSAYLRPSSPYLPSAYLQLGVAGARGLCGAPSRCCCEQLEKWPACGSPFWLLDSCGAPYGAPYVCGWTGDAGPLKQLPYACTGGV